VDTEAGRYLEFERWWGGYFRMTGAEIEQIVEDLFVGNKLARGEMMAGNEAINLRNITSPIVVFASWGDNITPPPQALDWIIDTWGDERAIAAAGRTIIYVLHESVGHLGIFVGGEIARKEHDQLVTSLDVIESLPPGLYEMKLEPKAGKEALRWEQLEPGDYTVQYQHRTMDDIRAVNPEGREEETIFSTISKVSELNTAMYKSWFRPWVRMVAKRPVADAMGKLHSLRLQRQMFSDAFPLAPFIREFAKQARSRRAHVDDDHPLRKLERTISEQITHALDQHRDHHNDATVAWTRFMFGPQMLGAWFRPDEPDADIAHARAQCDLAAAREAVLGHITEGGFAEAVCRIVVAGMVSVGAFERRSLRLARLLAHLPSKPDGSTAAPIDWIQILKDQARITAVAPVEALNALEQMLPDTASRERALAASAAVMMIEPTLANPRSEIIEFLIGTLNVDPTRVIDLARKLTETLEIPVASLPVRKAAVRAKRAA
jgi:hypothetical protein